MFTTDQIEIGKQQARESFNLFKNKLIFIEKYLFKFIGNNVSIEDIKNKSCQITFFTSSKKMVEFIKSSFDLNLITRINDNFTNDKNENIQHEIDISVVYNCDNLFKNKSNLNKIDELCKKITEYNTLCNVTILLNYINSLEFIMHILISRITNEDMNKLIAGAIKNSFEKDI